MPEAASKNDGELISRQSVLVALFRSQPHPRPHQASLSFQPPPEPTLGDNVYFLESLCSRPAKSAFFPADHRCSLVPCFCPIAHPPTTVHRTARLPTSLPGP